MDIGSPFRPDDTDWCLLSLLGFSVTVDEEECDEVGGICELWTDDDGLSTTEGTADESSSSGFAIRSPPRYVSVRLISPFMAAGLS